MSKLKNQDIRDAAKNAGVPLWKVGRVMGISEASVTRKLREPLSEEERDSFLKAIQAQSIKETEA